MTTTTTTTKTATKPTPTEEQVAAVRAALRHGCDDECVSFRCPRRLDALVALLAEREAPLRERAEKAEALADVEAERRVVSALTYAVRTQERDAAVERAEKAEAEAKTMELAADAMDHDLRSIAAERDAARAEVARLTAERDEYRAHFGSVAHGRAAFDEMRAALAASRAEVEALRADVAAQTADHIKCMGAVVEGRKFGDVENNANQRILKRAAPFCVPLGALTIGPGWATWTPTPTSTPAPASAEPATPTTSPDCPRESPLCITKGAHAADECDVDTAVLRAVATPTTEGGAK